MLTDAPCPPVPGLSIGLWGYPGPLYIVLGVYVALLIIGLVTPRRWPVKVYWIAFAVGTALFISGYVISFDVVGPSHDALSNWLTQTALTTGCYSSATQAQFFQQGAFLDRIRHVGEDIGIAGTVVAIVPTILSLLWLTPYARRYRDTDQTATP
jgi:hypothetical protein